MNFNCQSRLITRSLRLRLIIWSDDITECSLTPLSPLSRVRWVLVMIMLWVYSDRGAGDNWELRAPACKSLSQGKGAVPGSALAWRWLDTRDWARKQVQSWPGDTRVTNWGSGKAGLGKFMSDIAHGRLWAGAREQTLDKHRTNWGVYYNIIRNNHNRTCILHSWYASLAVTWLTVAIAVHQISPTSSGLYQTWNLLRSPVARICLEVIM